MSSNQFSITVTTFATGLGIPSESPHNHEVSLQRAYHGSINKKLSHFCSIKDYKFCIKNKQRKQAPTYPSSGVPCGKRGAFQFFFTITGTAPRRIFFVFFLPSSVLTLDDSDGEDDASWCNLFDLASATERDNAPREIDYPRVAGRAAWIRLGWFCCTFDWALELRFLSSSLSKILLIKNFSSQSQHWNF